MEDDSKEVIEQDIRRINTILQKESIDAKMEAVEMNYFKTPQYENGVLIARASDYNRFASLIGEKELHPAENEAIVVEQSDAMLMEGPKASEGLMKSGVLLNNGQEIQPSKVVESEVLPALNGYYVVNDKVYEQLGLPFSSDMSSVWKADEGQDEKVLEAGRILNEEIPYKVFSVDYTLYEINKAFGPILFIGLFIGIVFFVSAGSFLYFRLFSDLDEDQRKFRAISKIGLTHSELKKVVNRQIVDSILLAYYCRINSWCCCAHRFVESI